MDMFWSRARSTVEGHQGRVRRCLEEAAFRERPSPFSDFPSWRIGDGQGMGIALLMLTESLKPGRNADYTQFDTCRNSRSIASNIYAASSRLDDRHNVLKSRKGESLHLHDDPMQSMLMERFVVGMETRMPEAVVRNEAIAGETLAAMLRSMREEMSYVGISIGRKRDLIMAGSYMAVLYGGSLRGNEGLMMSGDCLRDHIGIGRDDTTHGSHVVVGLVGHFKNERGARMHAIPIVDRTRSGVEVRWWLEQLKEVLDRENNRGCPAFCDSSGFLLTEKYLEDIFQPVLERLLEDRKNRHLWMKDCSVKVFCRAYRSFRRGAASEAVNQGIDEDTIQLVNRWRAFERSRGKQPGMNMLHHYVAGKAVRRRMLTFSASI